MNPWYALMESEYRYLYLAACALGLACVGAMAMIAYNWSHDLARIWFWLLFAATVGCAVKGLQEWIDPPDRNAIPGVGESRKSGGAGDPLEKSRG